MFLSHNVVPVFVVTVLFYLYSSSGIVIVPENYDTCKECLQSTCHTVKCGPCTLTLDNCTFQCFTCTTDLKGNPEYYSEADCTACCKDKDNTCACVGFCYACVPKKQIKDMNWNCAIPKFKVDDECATVPYAKCTESSPTDDDEP